MNAARRGVVREIIQSKPFISLTELEERFPEVSSMTIRRDIDYFEKQGEAIKVRGGARSMKFIKTTMEDAYVNRATENVDAKLRICEKAFEFLEGGRSTFFDSGTTIMKLADLVRDEYFNITTTAPNVAIKLLRNSSVVVYLVGGMVGKDNISISGTPALEYLRSVNIDTAFMVPSGFSLENGFTSGNYGECEVKKLIIEKARRKIMLMDNSKIDRILPYTFAGLDKIDIIITDKEPSEKIAEAAKLAQTGILVV
ncbi:DeoR family transcriptional regulator [Clostridia bacterium]|nr:DeoR family transcriptional regulator [Clostridia bacterium]